MSEHCSTGSTNTIVGSTLHEECPIHATLAVVLGKKVEMDVGLIQVFLYIYIFWKRNELLTSCSDMLSSKLNPILKLQDNSVNTRQNVALSFASVGFFGRVAFLSSKLRWAGPSRY